MIPVSDNSCVVTIVPPAAAGTVWIRLIGVVGMGAEVALGGAVDRLRQLNPRTVHIDVAGVTYAGAVLVHFLLRLHDGVPAASIHLHRAGPMIRVLVGVTGLDGFVTLDRPA